MSPNIESFDLTKEDEQSDTAAQPNEGVDEQISAADYDPSLDRREDEEKRVRAVTAKDNLHLDIGMAAEEVVEEEEEEEDVDDMFALDTTEKKENKESKESYSSCFPSAINIIYLIDRYFTETFCTCFNHNHA